MCQTNLTCLYSSEVVQCSRRTYIRNELITDEIDSPTCRFCEGIILLRPLVSPSRSWDFQFWSRDPPHEDKCVTDVSFGSQMIDTSSGPLRWGRVFPNNWDKYTQWRKVASAQYFRRRMEPIHQGSRPIQVFGQTLYNVRPRRVSNSLGGQRRFPLVSSSSSSCSSCCIFTK